MEQSKASLAGGRFECMQYLKIFKHCSFNKLIKFKLQQINFAVRFNRRLQMQPLTMTLQLSSSWMIFDQELK